MTSSDPELQRSLMSEYWHLLHKAQALGTNELYRAEATILKQAEAVKARADELNATSAPKAR